MCGSVNVYKRGRSWRNVENEERGWSTVGNEIGEMFRLEWRRERRENTTKARHRIQMVTVFFSENTFRLEWKREKNVSQWEEEDERTLLNGKFWVKVGKYDDETFN